MATSSTGHISVQLCKSEAAGGKRKAKDLLATCYLRRSSLPESTTTCTTHHTPHGGKAIHALHASSPPTARQSLFQMMWKICVVSGERSITHLKSTPRSHRYNSIEGRMKTPVPKALSACHYSLLWLSAHILPAFQKAQPPGQPPGGPFSYIRPQLACRVPAPPPPLLLPVFFGKATAEPRPALPSITSCLF
jgi:hypothetical protein